MMKAVKKNKAKYRTSNVLGKVWVSALMGPWGNLPKKMVLEHKPGERKIRSCGGSGAIAFCQLLSSHGWTGGLESWGWTQQKAGSRSSLMVTLAEAET